MSVDLPAPLGPSRPKIEPRGMSRSMPSSAVTAGRLPAAAVDLVRCLISTASVGRPGADARRRRGEVGAAGH